MKDKKMKISLGIKGIILAGYMNVSGMVFIAIENTNISVIFHIITWVVFSVVWAYISESNNLGQNKRKGIADER